MRMFEVHGVEIAARRSKVFDFVRRPENLPRWAQAFQAADENRARLETPAGTVEIALHTNANAQAGTIDWRMEFPDGTVGIAQSRVTETTRGTSVYSFVLHAPPVPLEALEGALAVQSETLRAELSTLRQLLEAS